MKKIKKISLSLFIVILTALIFPISVSAAPIEDGKTILGENFTLESGKMIDGDLNVIGGVVEIEKDASVKGNVFILGGVVDIDGTVEGDLNVIGGTVTLESHAIIEGDLYSPAGFVNQEEGAKIQGSTNQGWAIPWTNIEMPQVQTPRVISTPRIGLGLSPLLRLAEKVGKTLVFVGLAALMLLIMPKSSEEMTKALVAKPWHVLGYGALTALVMIVGGVLLSLTICLIPVVVLVGLAFGLALLAGWLALGFELGKRIATIFKTSWHPVVSAVLGTLALQILASSLHLIPCLGNFLVFAAALFGLGMAVVTLFGTKAYPRPEEVDSGDPLLLVDGTTDAGIDQIPPTNNAPEENNGDDEPTSDQDAEEKEDEEDDHPSGGSDEEDNAEEEKEEGENEK